MKTAEPLWCNAFVDLYEVAWIYEIRLANHSQRVQLACLLHDASEAYLSDITRPVKAELPRYREIEKPLQMMIWQKWLGDSLTEEEESLVFRIDNDILAHEFLMLMDTKLIDQVPLLASVPEYAFRGFDSCEQDFISQFQHLMDEEQSFFTVGIDWMKPSWLAVELRGKALSARCFSHIGKACDAYQNADTVFIDIPVGLPENKQEDQLRPDKEARNLLPAKRKSTIFPVPCRQAIYSSTEAEAKQINTTVLNRGMSKQTYGFSKMIQQVDTYLQQTPAWKNRLLESHPEVAFQLLNNGSGLLQPHRTEVRLTGKYRYLTFEDRKKIEAWHLLGDRPVDIAARLSVHHTTIYKELQRGATGALDANQREGYSAELAERRLRESFKRRGKRAPAAQ